jgi:6-phosphogluconolactonase
VLLFIGTYTTGSSEGIYTLWMNPETAELQPASIARGIPNPSFLALHPRRPCLYSVIETKDFEGEKGGAVASFKVDDGTGELRHLNSKPTNGVDPCHLAVDATGRFLLAANYGGGSVTVFSLKEDGSLADKADFRQHHGSSINPERQRSPHAHSVTLDPSNRYIYAADLGLDKIMIYQLDASAGKLHPNDPPFAVTKPGSGPRHFCFHPDGGLAFLINELGNTVTSYRYERSNGSLRQLHTVPTLPANFTDHSTCADIHVHPNGRFVYGSNRGHDSIAIFALEESARASEGSTGALSLVDIIPTGGANPRNFAIDPTGRFLLAANQDSDSIVVFHIDPKTGRIFPTGRQNEVPTPVCILFWQKPMGKLDVQSAK